MGWDGGLVQGWGDNKLGWRTQPDSKAPKYLKMIRKMGWGVWFGVWGITSGGW